MVTPERIIVIDPAGEWGSAFGKSVAENHPSYEVRFLLHKLKDLPLFLETREMRRLPGYPMPANVTVTLDVQKWAMGADLFVLAAKSKFFRTSYLDISPVISYGTPIVILTKGLEQETNLMMTEIILEEDPGRIDDITALAGPNGAKEVAGGALVGAVVAAYNYETAVKVQDMITSDKFRVYASDDVVGVEIGAVLKNILSLGAGMADEKHMPQSTKAFFVTRGLEEMARFGEAFGAHQATFRSLSFLGDLLLGCYGGITRNYLAGTEIAKKLSPSSETLEGLDSIDSVIALAKQHNPPISMPLIEMINEVVKGKDLQAAMYELMGRPPTKEQLVDKGLVFNANNLGIRIRHKLCSAPFLKRPLAFLKGISYI